GQPLVEQRRQEHRDRQADRHDDQRVVEGLGERRPELWVEREGAAEVVDADEDRRPGDVVAREGQVERSEHRSGDEDDEADGPREEEEVALQHLAARTGAHVVPRRARGFDRRSDQRRRAKPPQPRFLVADAPRNATSVPGLTWAGPGWPASLWSSSRRLRPA